MNLTSRKDYIEADYVKGVFDSQGKQVIRELTSKEKDFLNKFYEETIVTNFYHDPELKRLNNKKREIVEDVTIKALKNEIRKLEKNQEENRNRIKQLREIIRITKKQNEETFSDQLDELEDDMQELREKLLLYPDKEDHKIFYNENNARNACIFNKKRITGQLTDFKLEEYEAFLENSGDYDNEYIPEEEYDESLNERSKVILEEIIEYFKEKKS